MGIEPFLVGSALDCVLAQRLARRLCSKCKETYTPTEETLVAARYPWVKKLSGGIVATGHPRKRGDNQPSPERKAA